jgi:hypothetical protein
MRRTFVGLWALAICVVVACGAMARQAGAQSATHRSVRVKPSVGYPGTWFRVAFRAPDSAGKVGDMVRYYVISARGPAGSSGCARRSSKYVSKARSGTRERVRLTPGRRGWCLGHFDGTVTEQEQPYCPFREVCPDYVVRIRTVGRFSFEVHAQPPGGDVTPPVFAGLESAVGCAGGPEGTERQTISHHLTWKPAHDQVTPRSQIVYDIFTSISSCEHAIKRATRIRTAPSAAV